MRTSAFDEGILSLTYVITTLCVGNKAASCVDVCPVDAIHPTPGDPAFAQAEQLYIDPDTCIDCDSCFEQCPVTAIQPESRVPTEFLASIAANAEYFA